MTPSAASINWKAKCNYRDDRDKPSFSWGPDARQKLSVKKIIRIQFYAIWTFFLSSYLCTLYITIIIRSH